MSERIVKKIVAVTGNYEKDGEVKNKYTNLWVLIMDGEKISIKMESITVGWDGRANAYDFEKKGDNNIDNIEPF